MCSYDFDVKFLLSLEQKVQAKPRTLNLNLKSLFTYYLHLQNITIIKKHNYWRETKNEILAILLILYRLLTFLLKIWHNSNL